MSERIKCVSGVSVLVRYKSKIKHYIRQLSLSDQKIMSSVSSTMATQPDTRGPYRLKFEKDMMEKKLNRDVNDLLDDLEHSLENYVQVACIKLGVDAKKLRPELRRPDSKHYQRVEQVLRHVQFFESAMLDAIDTHQAMMEEHARWDVLKFRPPMAVSFKAPRRAIPVSSKKSKKQKN